MQHFASHDLPKAVSSLAQAERTLDDYTRIAPEGGVAGNADGKEAAGEPQPQEADSSGGKGEEQ